MTWARRNSSHSVKLTIRILCLDLRLIIHIWSSYRSSQGQGTIFLLFAFSMSGSLGLHRITAGDHSCGIIATDIKESLASGMVGIRIAKTDVPGSNSSKMEDGEHRFLFLLTMAGCPLPPHALKAGRHFYLWWPWAGTTLRIHAGPSADCCGFSCSNPWQTAVLAGESRFSHTYK